MANVEEVTTALGVLNIYFGLDADHALRALWVRVLEPLTAAQLEAAVDEVIKDPQVRVRPVASELLARGLGIHGAESLFYQVLADEDLWSEGRPDIRAIANAVGADAAEILRGMPWPTREGGVGEAAREFARRLRHRVLSRLPKAYRPRQFGEPDEVPALRRSR